jgi:hypothetical protein
LFRELWEFTECGLRIVKELFIKSPEPLEKAATLYLLYSLYLKQPLRPRVRKAIFKAEFGSKTEANFLKLIFISCDLCNHKTPLSKRVVVIKGEKLQNTLPYKSF